MTGSVTIQRKRSIATPLQIDINAVAMGKGTTLVTMPVGYTSAVLLELRGFISAFGYCAYSTNYDHAVVPFLILLNVNSMMR